MKLCLTDATRVRFQWPNLRVNTHEGITFGMRYALVYIHPPIYSDQKYPPWSFVNGDRSSLCYLTVQPNALGYIDQWLWLLGGKIISNQ